MTLYYQQDHGSLLGKSQPLQEQQQQQKNEIIRLIGDN